MADFARPTYSILLDRIQSDLDARLTGTDSRLRRSPLDTIAKMEAGIAHGIYGLLEFISQQIFPDTATAEFLNRWGVIYGVERLQAVAAKGNVTFTGTDTTVIPGGTILQRSDLAQFTLDASVTISGTTINGAVTAQNPGIVGNTATNSTLSFVSPIAGIDSNAVVATPGITGGLDLESDIAYLQRILLKIQQPAQGGAVVDYEAWARNANVAVTSVWVYPLEDGPGTVTVRFMTYGATSNGVPTSDMVDIVQSYISSVKPVTASVTVEAPTPLTVNFTIALTINDGFVLADVKAQVAANLADMLVRDASPGGTIYKSRIIDNILSTPGVFNATVSVPASDVTTSTGEIAVMGTITWS